MFAELLKSRYFMMAAAALPAALILLMVFSGQEKFRVPWKFNDASNDSMGSDSIAKMRESLARDRNLLAEYEREQSVLRAEVIKQRKLFQEGQISKAQVLEGERNFVEMLKRVYETRAAVTETDIAITEAILGEKVLRLPVLPVGGFSETKEFARFNGPSKWSIKEAPRIEAFFSQTFGRRLPITALGQSATHNRLGFDHRDSMDVGLHPDSAEGRSLVEYLRKAGIPFLAFRQAIAGAATGPHIHIGRASGRLLRG